MRTRLQGGRTRKLQGLLPRLASVASVASTRPLKAQVTPLHALRLATTSPRLAMGNLSSTSLRSPAQGRRTLIISPTPCMRCAGNSKMSTQGRQQDDIFPICAYLPSPRFLRLGSQSPSATQQYGTGTLRELSFQFDCHSC